jgi:hypothetical protein
VPCEKKCRHEAIDHPSIKKIAAEQKTKMFPASPVEGKQLCSIALARLDEGRGEMDGPRQRAPNAFSLFGTRHRAVPWDAIKEREKPFWRP